MTGQLITAIELNLKSQRELFILVTVDRLELGELTLLERDDQLLVDLENLLQVLDFPIQLNLNAAQNPEQLDHLTADGWFIRPTNLFQIQTDAVNSIYQILAANQTFSLQKSEVAVIGGQLYVPLPQALSWFGIKYNVNLSSMSMQLMPSQRLPIQDRLLRRNRHGNSFNTQVEAQYPREDEPYRLISPIFADVQLSAQQDYAQNQRYGLSVLGAGDLAYMTGKYFLNTSYSPDLEEKTTTNFRLALERNSIDQDLLGPLNASQIALGDISPVSINQIASSSNDVGIRLSNRPYGRITNANTTNFIGLQQPGWDVELYRNGIFLASQTIDEDGQYQFLDQQLFVGENVFTLNFYGPQGQREEVVESFNLTQASLVGGSFIYDVSLTKQDSQLYDFVEDKTPQQDYYRFNSHLEKGFGPNLSVTADLSSYHFMDGERHQYVQPGVRFYALNTLMNVQHLQDLDAGSKTAFNLARAYGQTKTHKINYELYRQSEDFKTNITTNLSSPIEYSQQLRLNGPLLTHKKWRLNYAFQAGQTHNYDQSSKQNYAFNLGGNYARINLSNNLNYNINQPAAAETETLFSGNTQLSTAINQYFFRSGLQYNLSPDTKVNAGFFNVLWNISPEFSSEYRIDYSFLDDATSHNVTFNWMHNHFTASLHINQNAENISSGLLTVRFSLGRDPLRKQLFVSPQRMSSYGAVSALVYEDLNNNQFFDEEEPLMENVEVESLQFRRRARTGEDGTAFITGLYDTQVTDIQVNPASLTDPFWIPSKSGISFLPRPGLVKVIEIPIVTAGEVEGTVKYVQKLFESPIEQGRVPMLLTNLSTGYQYEENTAFDGFFLFTKIPPGYYRLTVNENFLKKNKLKSNGGLNIEIGANGTLVVGADFEIYPDDIFEVRPYFDTPTTTYLLNLGYFYSAENAQMVMSVLQRLYPKVFEKMEQDQPFELTRTSNNQNPYLLKLGPVVGLNQAKSICAELIANQLGCKIEKQQ